MWGLIAKKVGMTQIIDPYGDLVPVTVLQAGQNAVTAIRTRAKHGYDALQLGSNVPDSRHPKRVLKEFRLGAGQKADDFKVGQEMRVELFEEGEFVDVRGVSKGKGFQGGTRRWGMKGGPGTHGSMYHRRPGSAGSTTFPGRTWRGHHNPGRMGGDQTTVQNLLVMKVLKDDNALLLRGAVPGARNAVLTVSKSFKKVKVDLKKLKVIREEVGKKDAKKTQAKKPAPKK